MCIDRTYTIHLSYCCYLREAMAANALDADSPTNRRDLRACPATPSRAAEPAHMLRLCYLSRGTYFLARARFFHDAPWADRVGRFCARLGPSISIDSAFTVDVPATFALLRHFRTQSRSVPCIFFSATGAGCLALPSHPTIACSESDCCVYRQTRRVYARQYHAARR